MSNVPSGWQKLDTGAGASGAGGSGNGAFDAPKVGAP